jgi:phenylalanyl-tRNA synthetase alpha chain
LKYVLKTALSEFFGKNLNLQFRPSYFPFVEPGFEVAAQCPFCMGAGCHVCSGGWLELLGAGMIHPHVFEAAGYEAGKYTGFAFGMGIQRLAMVKYSISDVRLFAENDLKFLSQ